MQKVRRSKAARQSFQLPPDGRTLANCTTPRRSEARAEYFRVCDLVVHAEAKFTQTIAARLPTPGQLLRPSDRRRDRWARGRWCDRIGIHAAGAAHPLPACSVFTGRRPCPCIATTRLATGGCRARAVERRYASAGVREPSGARRMQEPEPALPTTFTPAQCAYCGRRRPRGVTVNRPGAFEWGHTQAHCCEASTRVPFAGIAAVAVSGRSTARRPETQAGTRGANATGGQNNAG